MEKETVEYIISLEGKKCPTFSVCSNEGNKFAELSSLKEDLKFSKDCLSILLAKDIEHISIIQPDVRPPEELTIVFSLLKSAIISYGRTFNTSEANRVQLHAQIFKCIDDTNTHNEIIALRNSYIAHAGISEFEKIETRVSLDPERQKNPQIYSTIRYAINFVPDKLKKYIDLINKVLIYVQNQLDKKGKTIFRNDVKPHLKEWYETISSSNIEK